MHFYSMLQKWVRGAKKQRAQSRIEIKCLHMKLLIFFFLQYYYFTLNFLIGSNMMSSHLPPLGFCFLVNCMEPCWKIFLVSEAFCVHSSVFSPVCLLNHMSKSNSCAVLPADLGGYTSELSPDKSCKDRSLRVLSSKRNYAEVLGNSN